MTLYIKFQKIIFSDILKTKEDSNMNKSFCTIKVLDQGGNFYDNAFIENDFDAIMIALFYRNVLGYTVQVWQDDRDITARLDIVKLVSVKSKEERK